MRDRNSRFTAIVRSRLCCSASQTSPMPPRPISWTSRYPGWPDTSGAAGCAGDAVGSAAISVPTDGGTALTDHAGIVVAVVARPVANVPSAIVARGTTERNDSSGSGVQSPSLAFSIGGAPPVRG